MARKNDWGICMVSHDRTNAESPHIDWWVATCDLFYSTKREAYAAAYEMGYNSDYSNLKFPPVLEGEDAYHNCYIWKREDIERYIVNLARDCEREGSTLIASLDCETIEVNTFA